MTFCLKTEQSAVQKEFRIVIDLFEVTFTKFMNNLIENPKEATTILQNHILLKLLLPADASQLNFYGTHVCFNSKQ